MNKKYKILFIYTNPSSFVRRDLELLRKKFGVRTLRFSGTKNLPVFILKMLKDVLWADLTFSWFAYTHAFFAVLFSKIFGKKSIVIVAGYDVAKLPEIGYGALLNPKLARMTKYALGKADKVLTVDDGLKEDAIKNVGVTGKNIQTIPLGFDHTKFKLKGKKEDLVITVSAGDSLRIVRLKGLDTFVESAKFLPNVKFSVISTHGDALRKLKEIAPSNVEFISPLSQDELIKYYQKSKVYCQLSMREGHPNALCEAMLCECVPIGTDVQGVRTVIGDMGFSVPYGDPKASAEAIKVALNSDKGIGARKRIKKLFKVELREKRLMDIINKLLG